MKKQNNQLPTRQQVVKFEMLSELADSVYVEVKEFSKKKPDDALNPFKVKKINQVLGKLKEFLTNEPTAGFLDLLDEESLPSNSDAILVIGQFKASMENFKRRYRSGYGIWRTVGNPTASATLDSDDD